MPASFLFADTFCPSPSAAADGWEHIQHITGLDDRIEAVDQKRRITAIDKDMHMAVELPILVQ